MSTDELEYGAARDRMTEMFLFNQVGILAAIPNRVGLCVSGGAALLCAPLVFEPHTAAWFAEQASVTLETTPNIHTASIADVGAWTWTWMEPMLGTASFAILCLQLFRAQMKRLALRPWSDALQSARANRLAAKYPAYSRGIVKDFARSQPLRGPKYSPVGKAW